MLSAWVVTVAQCLYVYFKNTLYLVVKKSIDLGDRMHTYREFNMTTSKGSMPSQVLSIQNLGLKFET